MPPRKSRAKPKDDINADVPKTKRAPDIQWAKNPDWTFTLIAYLGDHVSFRLKLFSDSTADATKEGRAKHTAKDGKAQQYAILARHIFASEPGQSALYLHCPGAGPWPFGPRADPTRPQKGQGRARFLVSWPGPHRVRAKAPDLARPWPDPGSTRPDSV